MFFKILCLYFPLPSHSRRLFNPLSPSHFSSISSLPSLSSSSFCLSPSLHFFLLSFHLFVRLFPPLSILHFFFFSFIYCPPPYFPPSSITSQVVLLFFLFSSYISIHNPQCPLSYSISLYLLSQCYLIFHLLSSHVKSSPIHTSLLFSFHLFLKISLFISLFLLSTCFFFSYFAPPTSLFSLSLPPLFPHHYSQIFPHSLYSFLFLPLTLFIIIFFFLSPLSLSSLIFFLFP